MKHASVYAQFSGDGVCIETAKGRVKLDWDDIPNVCDRLAGLAHAHQVLENVEEMNRNIIALAERAANV